MNIIRIKVTGARHRQRTSISGLSDGDLRLIARAIEAGSFAGGDQGGDVSAALVRFAHAITRPVQFGPLGAHTIASAVFGEQLYEATENLAGAR